MSNLNNGHGGHDDPVEASSSRDAYHVGSDSHGSDDSDLDIEHDLLSSDPMNYDPLGQK